MQSPIDILLVDDQPRNLDALVAILDDAGYRLLRAETAESALRQLLHHDVAVVVLDIQMPGMSGLELARTLKNTKRFRDTPVVFLTAHLADPHELVEGYDAGAVDYLTKPVNPAVLRRKIAVFAELHRKTRQLAEANARLAELNERLEERVGARTAELEKSEAALRASARQKDEFLAVLAHELRNPLAPLRTGLDLIRRLNPSPVDSVLGKSLAAMDRQLQHVTRLIEDLLDISRLSRGYLALKRERADLGAIVQAVVESLRPQLDKRQQVVSTELPEVVYETVDPTRISQIVTNLLHNALKFTPTGGSIRIGLQREADAAVIQVSDSGLGIRSDQIDKVFDMFVRIERRESTLSHESGLGIGLALSRRLSQLHGGELTAFSAGEGLGTTFTLRLPLTQSAADETGRKSIPPNRPGAQLDILVVEDLEDVAELLVHWLEGLGHRVSVAYTGATALEAVKTVTPSVVLCDLGLPDFDGVDVCRQVRALPIPMQPTMIALTGWGRAEDMRRTKEAGFDLHLVKPVAPEKLRAVLEGVGRSALEPTAAH